MVTGDLVSSNASMGFLRSVQDCFLHPHLLTSKPSWWPLPRTVTHQPQLPARPGEDLPLSAVSACKHDQHPAHQLPPGLQLFSVQLQSSYATLLGQLNFALGSSSGSSQYHGTYYPPYHMNAPQEKLPFHVSCSVSQYSMFGMVSQGFLLIGFWWKL